jgi:hypothetical protein
MCVKEDSHQDDAKKEEEQRPEDCLLHWCEHVYTVCNFDTIFLEAQPPHKRVELRGPRYWLMR